MKQLSVQHIVIENHYDSQRIDNFLFSQFRNIPKSRIYRAIRTGEVRVNQKRVEATYRLIEGETVRIPPFKTTEKISPFIQDTSVDKIKKAILYEDDRLIILNKPYGIPVHGGTEQSYGLIDILKKLRPDIKSLELPHRLDKDTSGCLIVSKKRSILKWLNNLFKENSIIKEYLCLTKGAWKKGESRLVDLPLKKNILQSGERMVHVNYEGKPSKTGFSSEQSFEAMTLVRARLYTGRTHQIRVHLQSIHHPIVGDEKYGDKLFNAALKKAGVNRMFLHAEFISFNLPDGEKIELRAPLDESLEKILQIARHYV